MLRRIGGIVAGLVGIAAVLAGSFYLPVRPARIQSGSMAPHLLGPHWQAHCTDCGWSYDLGIEYYSDAWPVACPHCGAGNQVVSNRAAPGDQVAMDHRYRLVGRPSRWEVVGIRTPSGQLAAKRVWGLAGETVQLRDGDLWVDGRQPQRSLATLLETCVLVHDDRFRTETGRGPWQCSFPASKWLPLTDGYRFPGKARPAVAPPRISGSWKPDAADRPKTCGDWLVCDPSRLGSDDAEAMTDHYSYNAFLPRTTQVCEDWLLTASVQLSSTANLRVRVYYDGAYWSVGLDAQRRGAWMECSAEGGRRKSAAWKAGPEPGQIAVAACDGWVRVWWRGRPLLQARAQGARGESDGQAPAAWALSVSDGQANIRTLRLYRDLYLLAHPDTESPIGAPSTWQLDSNEYFVLGDNLPISQDSRTWGPVARGQLIGRIHAAFR